MKKLILTTFVVMLFSNTIYAVSNQDVARWKKEGTWHPTHHHGSISVKDYFKLFSSIAQEGKLQKEIKDLQVQQSLLTGAGKPNTPNPANQGKVPGIVQDPNRPLEMTNRERLAMLRQTRARALQLGQNDRILRNAIRRILVEIEGDEAGNAAADVAFGTAVGSLVTTLGF